MIISNIAYNVKRAYIAVMLCFGCAFVVIAGDVYGHNPAVINMDTPGLFIPFTHPGIAYMGRIDHSKKDAVELIWPGSSAEITFTGTGVQALLKDESKSYYGVTIDHQTITKLKPDSLKHLYVLAKELPYGKHTVTIYKQTEYGLLKFYGFQLDAGAKQVNAPAIKNRKIEFYGNSITCGQGIDGEGGEFQTNYYSYASLTARHYNADYRCIAKSGIGLMVSWFPVIMKEMYNRLAPNDSVRVWDFKKYTPNVVVINLFQNDSWIMKQPQQKEFKRRFGNSAPTADFIIASYVNFLKEIRIKYPKAGIICCLGDMDATKPGSPWPGYIEMAVKKVNDSKIYTHFFPWNGKTIHPLKADHEVMAKSLIDFINENIKW